MTQAQLRRVEPVADATEARRHLTSRYYIPGFLGRVGATATIPLLPLYLREIGFSYTEVTVAIAATGMGAMVSNLPAALLLRRWSERRVHLGGLALMAVATAAIAGSLLLPVILMVRLAFGVGQGTWMLARKTHVQRVLAPVVRGRMLALFGGIGRAAQLAGPVIGAALVAPIGFRGAFLAAGAISGAGLIPAVLAARTELDLARPQSPEAREQSRFGPVISEHRRSLGLAGAGQICITAVRIGRTALVPLWGEHLGLSTASIGLLISLASATDLLLFPVAGHLMDRYGRLAAIVPSFSLMSLGLMVVPFTSGFLTFLVATVLIGLGNGLGSGTMMTMSSDLAPDTGAAEYLGVLSAIRDVGQIGGPIVVGVVADWFGLGVSAVVLGGIGFVGVAILVFGIGETHRPNAV